MATIGDEFDIGDQPQLRAEFRDIDGALINPSALLLKVKDPDGVVTEYTASAMSNPSIGVWTTDLAVVTRAGRWYYRWEASGTLIAAEEGSFYVRASRVL